VIFAGRLFTPDEIENKLGLTNYMTKNASADEIIKKTNIEIFLLSQQDL